MLNRNDLIEAMARASVIWLFEPANPPIGYDMAPVRRHMQRVLMAMEDAGATVVPTDVARACIPLLDGPLRARLEAFTGTV